MVTKLLLTGEQIMERITTHPKLRQWEGRSLSIYGVPRGGVPVALAIAGYYGFEIVERPEDAQVIVDDLIDSGATEQRFAHLGKQFVALFDKRDPNDISHGQWVVFPWEESLEDDMQSHASRLLQGNGLEASPKLVGTLLTFVKNLE